MFFRMPTLRAHLARKTTRAWLRFFGIFPTNLFARDNISDVEVSTESRLLLVDNNIRSQKVSTFNIFPTFAKSATWLSYPPPPTLITYHSLFAAFTYLFFPFPRLSPSTYQFEWSLWSRRRRLNQPPQHQALRRRSPTTQRRVRELGRRRSVWRRGRRRGRLKLWPRRWTSQATNV